MRTLVHEMRNQLLIATATVEALIDRKLEPSDTRLHALLDALLSLDALIDDIPSRTYPGGPIEMRAKPQTFDICALIKTVIDGVEAVALDQSINIEFSGCARDALQSAEFSGDRVRIAQILRNVLLNAVRYTPDNGVITVDCRRTAVGLEVDVEDNGKGLSEDDLAHLFEIGFRGSAAGERSGTGLGLALVKRLLTQQGGDIRALPRPEGTTFRIRFSEDRVDRNDRTRVS